MTELIVEDVRRILLGLLFVVAFGWMAAQVVPGGGDETVGAQQLAVVEQGIPPKP